MNKAMTTVKKPTEKEMVYSITSFLKSMQDDQSSATKDALAEVTKKLENMFGVDTSSVDEFIANDLGNDLGDVINAGIAKKKAGLYDADLADVQQDEHFAEYNNVIARREYYAGCSMESIEYLRRKSRVLAKFKEHCPRSDLEIDNPKHPLRTAFIKTEGRWPWANQKPQDDVDADKERRKREDDERLRKQREAEAKAKAEAEAAKLKADADAAAAKAAAAKKAPETPVEHLSQSNFVEKLNAIDANRDYTIIVDRSASMKLQGRWKSAEQAVKILSSAACKCDDDGITLYFFSSHSKTSKGEFPAFHKFENVKTQEDVMKLFSDPKIGPKGGTDLTRVLKDACSVEASKSKAQSILVITDGSPDDQKSSEELIVEISKACDNDSQLNITMVQVGNDEKADKYLDTLDTKLGPMGAKFDIVDCLPFKKIEGMDFGELMKCACFHHGL